jgi:hypothetical protein
MMDAIQNPLENSSDELLRGGVPLRGSGGFRLGALGGGSLLLLSSRSPLLGLSEFLLLSGLFPFCRPHVAESFCILQFNIWKRAFDLIEAQPSLRVVPGELMEPCGDRFVSEGCPVTSEDLIDGEAQIFFAPIRDFVGLDDAHPGFRETFPRHGFDLREEVSAFQIPAFRSEPPGCDFLLRADSGDKSINLL